MSASRCFAGFLLVVLLSFAYGRTVPFPNQDRVAEWKGLGEFGAAWYSFYNENMTWEAAHLQCFGRWIGASRDHATFESKAALDWVVKALNDTRYWVSIKEDGDGWRWQDLYKELVDPVFGLPPFPEYSPACVYLEQGNLLAGKCDDEQVQAYPLCATYVF